MSEEGQGGPNRVEGKRPTDRQGRAEWDAQRAKQKQAKTAADKVIKLKEVLAEKETELNEAEANVEKASELAPGESVPYLRANQRVGIPPLPNGWLVR